MPSFTIPPPIVFNNNGLNICLSPENLTCFSRGAFKAFNIHTNLFEILLVTLLYVYVGFVLYSRKDFLKEKFGINILQLLKILIVFVFIYGFVRVRSGLMFFTDWLFYLLLMILVLGGKI